jgi:hypothetical protein
LKQTKYLLAQKLEDLEEEDLHPSLRQIRSGFGESLKILQILL